MSPLSLTLFPLFVVLLIVTSLGELMLSSLWAPFYYRHGIPLLRRTYTLPANLNIDAQIPRLEQNLRGSWWRPRVVFRALSPTELAFRNNFGSRNPMQGLVRLEPAHGRMTISGYLYSSYLLIFPLLFAFVLGIGGLPVLFFIFMLGILLFSVLYQRRQYEQIARIIAATLETNADKESWAEKETAVPSAPPPAKPTAYPSFEPPKWSPPDTDPFGSAPATPTSGLSKIEIVLIVVSLVLMAAVAWFVVSFLTA